MISPDISIDQLQTALASAATRAPSSDYDLNGDHAPVGMRIRPAAVLMPLVERAGRINLVLTKRSARLKNHPGQIAFPGGKVDAGDATPMAAALREADEEIGLHSHLVQVIGALPNHETVTGFDVHPFVARVDPDFHAVPHLGEVEEVFEVPLSHVLKASNFLVEGRVWMGHMRYYYIVPYGPYYIWGATARMLRMLADRVENANAD